VRFPRIDVSLVCFVLVIAAAIPVALLRTKTYALGYELGRLKTDERELRQRNVELLSEVAAVQRSVRDKHISGARGSTKNVELVLPGIDGVLHAREPGGKSDAR